MNLREKLIRKYIETGIPEDIAAETLDNDSREYIKHTVEEIELQRNNVPKYKKR